MLDPALAQELFALVSGRLLAAGWQPTDEEVLPLLASMIGAHYALRGGGEELIKEVLDEVTAACRASGR